MSEGLWGLPLQKGKPSQKEMHEAHMAVPALGLTST